jgi:hypothetical protein
MLQDVSNPSGGPFALFYHVGKLYKHDGGNHADGLEAFSIATRNSPGWERIDATKEESQAFIFDPEYIRNNIKEHSKRFDNASASQFVVVQIERDLSRENKEEHIAGMRVLLQDTKRGNWRACKDKEWSHTLNSLARDKDEDLVVAAAHKQVVKDLYAPHPEICGSKKRRHEPHNTESSDQPAESKKKEEEGEFTDHVVEHHEGV